MSPTGRTWRHRERVVTAALTVAGATAIGSITAVPPPAAGIAAAQRAVRLTADGSSLLNVPINLLQDLINIPNTELQALTELGDSLIFSGPWLAASATNLWGEDPGDPLHFMGVVDALIPFKQISGLGQPEPGYVAPAGSGDVGPASFDDAAAAEGHLGLGQQVTLIADAEIPVSASSDADYSDPLFPVAPISGLTSVDRLLWDVGILSGQQQFPLLDNWFKVPLSDLGNGYTFDQQNDPAGMVDPSMSVGPNEGVPTDPVFGAAGTHPATAADFPDGLPKGDSINAAGDVINANGNPVNLMPFQGIDYKMDLSYPFQHFFQSLTDAPDLSVGTGSVASMADIAQTGGFEIPTIQEFVRTMQTLAAGFLIAFDPTVTGSSLFCGAEVPCDIPTYLQLPSLVKDIGNLDPGNPYIDHWLELFNTASTKPAAAPFGMAMGPTLHDVQSSGPFASPDQSLFDFGNPLPDNPPGSLDTPISFPVSPFIQNMIDFFKDSGIQGAIHNLADNLGFEPIDYANDASTAPAPDAGDALAANPLMDLDSFLDRLEAIGSQLSGGMLF